MSLTSQLANHLERALTGPMWHGPSLREALADVTAIDAATHPIPKAHSIWELVLHLAAWAEIARIRLAGHEGEPSAEENFPIVDGTSEATWLAALANLEESYLDLAQATAELHDEDLDVLAPGRDHSVAVMLHGVIEHATYHGGQIVMLKRALAGARSKGRRA